MIWLCGPESLVQCFAMVVFTVRTGMLRTDLWLFSPLRAVVVSAAMSGTRVPHRAAVIERVSHSLFCSSLLLLCLI